MQALFILSTSIDTALFKHFQGYFVDYLLLIHSYKYREALHPIMDIQGVRYISIANARIVLFTVPEMFR